MKKPLILIGGGGHCRSCIDVIEAEGKFAIQGIIDVPEKLGTAILNYTIIGDDNSVDEFIAKNVFFLITLGQVQSAERRRQLFQNLISRQAALATVISPTAVVSRYAQIGKGTIVMHGAIINAGATVGNNVILNSNALVEHDAAVSDHTHISTHAVLNGGAVIEESSFLGSNAVIVHNKRVGKEVVVGAGAVVTSDLLTPGTYIGNPAKRMMK